MSTYTPVTNIDWPSGLPSRPLVNEFQEQIEQTMIQSSIDIGPKTRRQRISKNVSKMVCNYILDYGQVEILREFYTQTTYGGTLSFNFTHPRTGEPIVARFGADPIMITPIPSKQKYKVTLIFERMPWQSQELFIPDASAHSYTLGSSYPSPIVWQNPTAWFHKGTYRRIWFIVISNISSVQTNFLGYYDLDTETFSDLLDLQSPNSSGTDNHHFASVITNKDGYILFSYDDVATSHNKGVIIKKSADPEDRSSFSIVYDGTVNGRNLWQAYPNLWRRAIDNRIFMFYRGNITSDGQYHNCLVYSDDGGDTWGTEKKIVEEINMVGDPINYYVSSNGSKNWIGLSIIVRNGANGKYKYAFFIKSSDGITWQNLEGTFSKNIETEGFITSDEMIDNCGIDLTLDENSDDYLAEVGVAVTDDGDFYILIEKLLYVSGSYDRYMLLFTYVNGVKKELDITDLWNSSDSSITGLGGSAIIGYPGGIVDLFTRRRDPSSGYDKMTVYRSYDSGVNWERIREIFDFADDNYVSYLRPALNTFDAEKSLVAFGVKNSGTYDPYHVILRR